MTLDYKELILNTIRQKYQYLLLGLTVLLVVYVALSGFFSKNKLKFFRTNNKETQTNQKDGTANRQVKYLVKEGDDLWHIAETTYGSGYNAYDIAQANNLPNASLIEIGQELILPSLSPSEPTKGEVAMQKTEQVTITGAQYTIQSGDYLWKIALEAYGDGYAWSKIAQANNLEDPNFIHAGNTLILPR